jgi:hypothetical protein
MVPYTYKPLASSVNTRLLVLYPHASLDAALDCTLTEVSLNDSPKYRALSYVWGAKFGTQPLLCDSSEIHITPNCESALRYLRRKNKTITLWVDAICINQKDTKERGQQVGIMGSIYREAYRVVIWLGAGSKKTARCFSHMWISSRILPLKKVSALIHPAQDTRNLSISKILCSLLGLLLLVSNVLFLLLQGSSRLLRISPILSSMSGRQGSGPSRSTFLLRGQSSCAGHIPCHGKISKGSAYRLFLRYTAMNLADPIRSSA